MTQDKLSFNVVGGPSKFDLMLSLFDGNKDPRRTVEFQLEGARRPITVGITMVQQEDGSGESWNFRGWVSGDDPTNSMFALNLHVDGYFSTRGRKGYITFEVPFHYEMRADERHKVILPANQLATEQYVERLRGNLGRDLMDTIKDARKM